MAANIIVFIHIVGSQNRSFIINKIVGPFFISRFFGGLFPRLGTAGERPTEPTNLQVMVWKAMPRGDVARASCE
jgi:hypothetical protein